MPPVLLNTLPPPPPISLPCREEGKEGMAEGKSLQLTEGLSPQDPSLSRRDGHGKCLRSGGRGPRIWVPILLLLPWGTFGEPCTHLNLGFHTWKRELMATSASLCC